MLNTLDKKENIYNSLHSDAISDILLFQKWEVIKSFYLTEKVLFFKSKSHKVNLCRKFTSQNLLEKYSINTMSKETIANMDLKTYKDCVYIINLDIKNIFNFEKTAENLIQIAVEKALYNTTDKKVIINLQNDTRNYNRLKKVLLNNGFIAEEDQSNYEKEMFGQTFSYTVQSSSSWNKVIKQKPILINK